MDHKTYYWTEGSCLHSDPAVFLYLLSGHLQSSTDLAELFMCAKVTTNRPQLKM